MKKGSFDQYLEEKLKGNETLWSELENIGRAIDISFQIFDLRQSQGLTQLELATMAQTSQSNIARLEDSDYTGYSLKTLAKIADALDAQLRINLIPKNKTQLSNGLTRSFTIIWDELANRSWSQSTATVSGYPANPPIYSSGTSKQVANNAVSESHFNYA